MLVSAVSIVLLSIALFHYFSKLKKNETPKNAMLLKFAMLVSSSLSVWSLYHLFSGSPTITVSVVVISLSVLILSLSATFTFFLATKSTPLGDINVTVGDQILPFSSAEFDSSSLKGKRFLLKFYRGSWCPYCSAELKIFEKLKPRLAEYGIQVVGISNDTLTQQQAHKIRDSISPLLVSDPNLTIIRKFGVEHHKALGATAEDTMNIFGIAMPRVWKMRYKSMSIPTSLLVDEHGKIVWLDQSEDYRLRAGELAVMSVVKANFDDKL